MAPSPNQSSLALGTVCGIVLDHWAGAGGALTLALAAILVAEFVGWWLDRDETGGDDAI